MRETEVADRALIIAQERPSLFVGEAVVIDDGPQWMAWEGAKRAWIESCESPNTRRAYTIAYRQFREYCDGFNIAPWEVASAAAQNWHLAMKGAELAPATVGLKLAAMSAFYDFVRNFYKVGTPDGREISLWPADRANPFDGVRRPKVAPYGRATFPATDEAKAILGVINTEHLTGKRDYALLFLILTTCQRSSAILGMRWGDIRPLGDGDYAFRYVYKGGDVREAWLPRECYAVMREYLKADGRLEGMREGDYIFVPLDPTRIQRLRPEAEIVENRPISNSQANRILKKYARRAGVEIEKAHIHGLRHAGARRRRELMKEHGRAVDIFELKNLLGHQSIATTQIYTDHVLNDPEDPTGRLAAQDWTPKGKRQRGKAKPAAEQERLL